MIKIKRQNEEYYINMYKVNYVNGYINKNNEYIIDINFSLNNHILITCSNFEEYLYILKKIKSY